jgi:hypothetical protein
MNRVTAAKFILKEIHNRDLSTSNQYVLSIMDNALEGSDILTKDEIRKLIDDSVNLYGMKVYL